MAFNAFGAGGGTVLSYFNTFSVGTKEDVRGCFEDCPVGAAARSAGVWDFSIWTELAGGLAEAGI